MIHWLIWHRKPWKLWQPCGASHSTRWDWFVCALGLYEYKPIRRKNRAP